MKTDLKFLAGRLIYAAYRATIRRHLPEKWRHYLDRPSAYSVWQSINNLSSDKEDDLSDALKNIGLSRYKISILMPVYKPSIILLRDAIRSVQDQIYTNWELSIVDDGSKDENLEQFIIAESAFDSRIRHYFLRENFGISQATNLCFERSSGEIIVFMDQDDLISKDCLSELILAFAGQPQLDLVYTDSDKLDLEGQRVSPSFKPGWSPVLLLSHMYFSHVVAVRRTIVEELGGLRSAFDGSQDYDFALRATERAREVKHVPKLLYHWRMLPGSTAISASSKSASVDAGLRAVEAAVERRNIAASVARPDWAIKAGIGLYELEFSSPAVDISVVLVRGRNHLDGLVDAIAKAPVRVREIVLVDQAGLDGLPVGQLRQLQGLGVAIRHVDCAADATLAQRYNVGAAHVPDGLILFTNGMSCPVRSNWLSQLAGYCSLPGVGAVGPRLMEGDKVWCAGLSVLPNGLVKRDFAGMPASKFGYLYRGRIAHECVALPAEAMMTPKSVHEAVGGFPVDGDDPISIGLQYCQLLIAGGLSAVNCAGVDFEKSDAAPWADAVLPPKGLHAGLLANPNLVETAGRGSAANYCAPLHGRSRTSIVFVSHNLEHEGAPITLLDLVAGLLADGMINATILSPRDGPLAERYRAIGAQVRIIDGLGRRAGLQEFLAYKTSLSQLYLELGASLVVVNTLEMFPAVNAAEDAGLASIWCHHESGSWHSYFRRSPPNVRAYAYAAFSQAYRVVFVAEATRRAWSVLELRRNFQVIRYGVPHARVTADMNRWRRDEAREHLGLSSDEVAILLVGSVCRRKGQKDILKAASGIPAAIRAKVKFHVVGAFVEQRYEEEIRKEYAEMPADVRGRIVFTGPVDDVCLYYRAADIFVLCSRQESAPRVLVEAMSFALPIVTTAVDGIPELVRPDRDAYFYAPGDFRKLAALLSDLVASIETATLGSEGPARVADICDYDGMIDKFSELIAQATAAGKNKLPMVLPAAH